MNIPRYALVFLLFTTQILKGHKITISSDWTLEHLTSKKKLTSLAQYSDPLLEQAMEAVFQYVKNSWSSPEKAKLIMELIISQKLTTCVEIGACAGSSALPILVSLQYLKKGHAYLIDAWSNEAATKGMNPDNPNTAWWATLDMNSLKNQLIHMIEDWNLTDYCTIIHETSQHAASQIDLIDFLHIDGNFSETGSLQDVMLYLPKVRSGGYILVSNLLVRLNGKYDKAKALSLLLDTCSIVCETENGCSILLKKKDKPINRSPNDPSYGYITCYSANNGDDIQSLAAQKLLGSDALGIDREHVNDFTYHKKINVIVQGWFMHDKNFPWNFENPLPPVGWPPAPIINPLFIGIHFTQSFLQTVFADENIEYLQQHAPIGARDLATLYELQKRNIPSYFSGCLTLTLENDCTERNDIIYLVDVPEACITHIKSRATSPVVVLTHNKYILQSLSQENRTEYATYFLNLYKKARCVVTTKLHVAMPCLGLETPVLFIQPTHKGDQIDPRLTGLVDFTHSCFREDLCNNKIDYNFDNPPQNSGAHLPFRENLIKVISTWIQDRAMHP